MYRIIVSELAHEDLEKIVLYIMEQLFNPVAAKKFLNQVEICYNRLKNNPLIYEKCKDKRLEKEGYRKAIVKNYLFLYKVDEDNKIISILRFFYGSQDYTKLI